MPSYLPVNTQVPLTSYTFVKLQPVLSIIPARMPAAIKIKCAFFILFLSFFPIYLSFLANPLYILCNKHANLILTFFHLRDFYLFSINDEFRPVVLWLFNIINCEKIIQCCSLCPFFRTKIL